MRGRSHSPLEALKSAAREPGGTLSSVSKDGSRSHLGGLQVLSILHPSVRRLRLPRGFALPHQRVVNELLGLLGLLDEMWRSWRKRGRHHSEASVSSEM